MGRAGRIALSVAAVLLAASLCGCSSTREAGISVSPDRALIDVPVSVRIDHLPAWQVVTVEASATDAHGVVWRSAARFRASPSGVVQLSDDAVPDPDGAVSYIGRDSMGLFELMRPTRGTETLFALPRSNYTVHLNVTGVGGVIGSTLMHRTTASGAGVRFTRMTVSRDGIDGTLFSPTRTDPDLPAVLLFGGSGGGEEQDLNAEMLAAHGFAALSIAYFHAPGLPATLDRIPLEYFVRALRLLGEQPGVDPRRIDVFGDSRGSEAAQLPTGNGTTPLGRAKS